MEVFTRSNILISAHHMQGVGVLGFRKPPLKFELVCCRLAAGTLNHHSLAAQIYAKTQNSIAMY